MVRCTLFLSQLDLMAYPYTYELLLFLSHRHPTKRNSRQTKESSAVKCRLASLVLVKTYSSEVICVTFLIFRFFNKATAFQVCL